MSRTPSVILEYQHPSTGAQTRRSKWRFVPFVLAAVIPFVPFACNVSPLHAAKHLLDPATKVFEEDSTMGMLALPFFLAFPLLAWRVRQDFTGVVTAVERAVAYVSGAAGWAMVVLSCGRITLRAWEYHGSWSAGDCVTVASMPGMLASGLILLVILTMRKDPRTQRPWVAMLTPYLANAAFCLVILFRDRQIGWYITVPVVVLGASDLLLIVPRGLRSISTN